MSLGQDLVEEFPDQQAAITELAQANPHFAKLAARSHDLWRKITRLETNPVGDDDELKKLKVERLGVLDEIGLMLRGGKKAPSQARKDGRE